MLHDLIIGAIQTSIDALIDPPHACTCYACKALVGTVQASVVVHVMSS